ncbi:Uncharacterized metal-binding protein [Rhodoblastus acidophilus]|uniref:Uncharacterized metal-binding protein n=1 Tax=Rhodoblastus acidophilus TaxID=1074 RepID=A0A212S991_RHOAC|nr:DUF1847 domain-containing protein [Rhodoblastus acidophilus]PPQ36254.1 DUF1847 domain-containing protein [Rhodoblastus acidophilus]RAI20424.1 DUF1847 domain-containing protein [Rhodoblastus acidophilus]SNB81851.1 Uncharacterized metal-binding protein [Rhodoblastus acidophilus]
MSKIETPTCSECKQLHCHRHDARYPKHCLTTALEESERTELAALYAGADPADSKLAHAAAEVEGLYYGKINRVEETVAFARRIGAARIGIATCFGLIEETRVLVKILRLAGFETFTALCKVGSIDKTEMGIAEELKIKCGSYEAGCNPILQARLLNRENTGLNIIMGLCVGHDSLFIKHSEAPVTTLVVKDRVLGHNPVAALYTVGSYSARLLDKERLESL